MDFVRVNCAPRGHLNYVDNNLSALICKNIIIKSIFLYVQLLFKHHNIILLKKKTHFEKKSRATTASDIDFRTGTLFGQSVCRTKKKKNMIIIKNANA